MKNPSLSRGPMPAALLIPLLLGAVGLGYSLTYILRVSPYWGLIVPAVVLVVVCYLGRPRRQSALRFGVDPLGNRRTSDD
jgi:hypothetical protein